MTTTSQVIAPPLLALLKRRSVSPKRLGPPGLTHEQLECVMHAALRAPDHGGLVPWRVIAFGVAQRHVLADLFVQEKSRRDPLVSDEDLGRARAHATNAPTLLAFVVCLRTDALIPLHEQWLAAGAALGNILNGIEVMGLGGIVLSGDRCSDRLLMQQLGVEKSEQLVGFISAGTVVKAPPTVKLKNSLRCWTQWEGLKPQFTPREQVFSAN